MSGECVYNLIPNLHSGTGDGPGKTIASPPAPRKPQAQCRAPPPTASTFGFHGTSAAVANVGGENTAPSAHPARKKHATFGRAVGEHVNPQEYLHKGCGAAPATTRPADFQTTTTNRARVKPDVPDRHDHPVMGLRTNKNYVVANAVENMLAIPPVPAGADEQRPTQRSDFGRVPAYVKAAKEEQEARRAEEDLRAAEVRARNDPWTVLESSDLAELRKGLQRRWEELNRAYQAKGLGKQRTPIQKLHEERIEKDLCAVEFLLNKVSRNTIYVFDDQRF